MGPDAIDPGCDGEKIFHRYDLLPFEFPHHSGALVGPVHSVHLGCLQ